MTGWADDGASVKTPDGETAQMLIDANVAIKAPYFHRSWVRLPYDSSADELRHRLAISYDLVRAGLKRFAFDLHHPDRRTRLFHKPLPRRSG